MSSFISSPTCCVVLKVTLVITLQTHHCHSHTFSFSCMTALHLPPSLRQMTTVGCRNSNRDVTTPPPSNLRKHDNTSTLKAPRTTSDQAPSSSQARISSVSQWSVAATAHESSCAWSLPLKLKLGVTEKTVSQGAWELMIHVGWWW